jgi:hypothetical protein
LGGAYTKAKNNGASPKRWNCSHNLVPSVLCFHRDIQSDHESFTNTATPPLCFTTTLMELMSNIGRGLCKHWKPGICNGVSLGNKCVSVSATTSESSNSLCICELVLSFVFVPHGCSTWRLVMLSGPSTPSAKLWLWCHWCKGLRHASKLFSFPLWPFQIDAMMPSLALAAIWSNPLPSPNGYLSELHSFDKHIFCPQL